MSATRFLDINKVRFTAYCRAVFSLILVLTAVFLVDLGQATAAPKAPTYSPEQLEQIQRYTIDVKELRDRMLEIPPMVQRRQWGNVQTFIHGPLGELRTKMSSLTRSLSPQTQKPAGEAAKDVFGHLLKIDEAAKVEDSRKALTNYNGALQDFDTFLGFVPSEVTAP
jgi:photosystem II protein PsbQ